MAKVELEDEFSEVRIAAVLFAMPLRSGGLALIMVILCMHKQPIIPRDRYYHSLVLAQLR